MKEEIACACEFLYASIRAQSGTMLTQEQLTNYKTVLNQLIIDKFTSHWYPDEPMKGNGFRCVNIDTKVVDPMLGEAAELSNISKDIFHLVFRFGLALWIDPGHVSYCTGRSSNVVSLYKSTRETSCIPIHRYQLPVSNSQFNYPPVYTIAANTMDLWKCQNMVSYPQLTSWQLRQILQRLSRESFYWASV
jgi:protein Tob/BTG